MKVILVQNEIEDAIRSYMSTTLSVPSSKDLKIEMTATRGASGVTAEINIVDKNASVEAEKLPEAELDHNPIAEPLTEEKPNLFDTPVQEEKPKKTKSFFADLQSSN